MGIKRKLVTLAAVEPVLGIVRAYMRRGRLPCLMYHEVLPDSQQLGLWTVVRAGEFDRQLEHTRRYYLPVSYEEALDEFRARKRWPQGAVVVTFDDGYRGNLETALPIAESHNVPVTVFVATRWVQEGRRHWFDRLMLYCAVQDGVEIDLEKYGGTRCRIARHTDSEVWWDQVARVLEFLKTLPEQQRQTVVDDLVGAARGHNMQEHLAPLTVEQLQALASSPLVTIGAHSHEHEILSRLPLQHARDSISKSRQLLEEWLSVRIRHFAYPNGNYSTELMDLLRELEFETAVTTRAGMWSSSDDLLALPRIGIGRYDPSGFFRARLAGLPV